MKTKPLQENICNCPKFGVHGDCPTHPDGKCRICKKAEKWCECPRVYSLKNFRPDWQESK